MKARSMAEYYRLPKNSLGASAYDPTPTPVFDSNVDIAENVNLANDYINYAVDIQPMGSDEYGNLSRRFCDILKKSNQKLRIAEILDAVHQDNNDPLFKQWDNTVLGSWYAYYIKQAWDAQGWGDHPPSDPNFLRLGNELALHVYSTMQPKSYAIAKDWLSKNPSEIPAEYLFNLGITPLFNGGVAAPLQYFADHPTYNPHANDKPTSTKNPTEPPPYDDKQSTTTQTTNTNTNTNQSNANTSITPGFKFNFPPSSNTGNDTTDQSNPGYVRPDSPPPPDNTTPQKSNLALEIAIGIGLLAIAGGVAFYIHKKHQEE